METIVSQFKTKELSFVNGRHHYYGSLVLDGDAAIWDNIVVHGDLVVRGNLKSHGKIVANNIKVDGDFIAGRNVVANSIEVGKMFGCYANVRLKSNLQVGSYFWVNGNLMVPSIKTKETSTVHGWMKANAVDGDVLVDRI